MFICLLQANLATPPFIAKNTEGKAVLIPLPSSAMPFSFCAMPFSSSAMPSRTSPPDLRLQLHIRVRNGLLRHAVADINLESAAPTAHPCAQRPPAPCHRGHKPRICGSNCTSVYATASSAMPSRTSPPDLRLQLPIRVRNGLFLNVIAYTNRRSEAPTPYSCAQWPQAMLP